MTHKTRIDDLAIFGGPKSFEQTLHVGGPNVGDRKRLFDRFNEILDRNWLTNNGPLVQEFERRIADIAGVRNCIATCNGTIALEIAIRGLGMTGEVIVPSWTFAATAHALRWQEITPVFCDINRQSYNLDPQRIEELITPLTTGIIGVHLWSRPCDTDAIQQIANRHNLRVLYDSSHAFGCTRNGVPIGSFGDAEIFSFHATKFMNTGEGGAIVTNNDELAHRLRLMRNFGFAGFDNVVHVGTNGKMTEFSAAMGLTNLESIDDFVAHNRENYRLYQRRLDSLPGVSVIEYDSAENYNYQYVVLEIDERNFGLSRDDVLRIMQAENVMVRRYFYPGCHRMLPYATESGASRQSLRATEEIAETVLLLPTGTQVSLEAAETIASIIELLSKESAAISQPLRAQGERV